MSLKRYGIASIILGALNYESGWTSIPHGQSHAFVHNLGTVQVVVSLTINAEPNAAGALTIDSQEGKTRAVVEDENTVRVYNGETEDRCFQIKIWK